MLWNVAGWLGTGLILNHAHHDDSISHCEISFCYCEVDEGEKICSCHHQNHHNKTDHDDHSAEGGHNAATCYFSDGQTPNTAAFQLVETTKLMAFYSSGDIPLTPPFTTTDPVIPNDSLLEGIAADLLRPPQV